MPASSLARQNGILLLLGGVVGFAWIAMRRENLSLRNAALWGGCALLAGIVVFTAANVALGTRLTKEYGGARQFRLLQAYDIIAALAAKPWMDLTQCLVRALAGCGGDDHDVLVFGPGSAWCAQAVASHA